MPRTQTPIATDSETDLRKVVGPDATADFEADPKFVHANPTADSSSENLAARDTDDLADSEEEEAELADAEEDEEDEEDEDEDEEEDDEDEDDVDDEDEDDDDLVTDRVADDALRMNSAHQ